MNLKVMLTRSGSVFPYTSGYGPTTPSDLKLMNIFDDTVYNLDMYKGTDTVNSNIDGNTSFISQVYDSSFGVGTYKLLNDDDKSENVIVNNLMKLSNSMTMEITNRGTNLGVDGWVKATWKTCLADLKSRKFKCAEVIYDISSENTGRIVEMRFEELGIH